MGMIKSKYRWLGVIAAAIAWVSLIAFVGCKGQTDAPFGSSISVTGPIVSGSTSTQDTRTATYTVMVLDSGGLPMSGIDVQLSGIFNTGDLISMNGSQAQSAQCSLSSTLTTGNGGFADLVITAPSLSIRALAAPQPTASAISSGGSLTVGNFQYVVVAAGPLGASTASGLASAPTTTPGSSVALTWPTVLGASGYDVYGDRGTTGATWYRLTATSLAATTTSYTDTGSSAAATTVPADKIGAALNTVTGSIYAVSGSVSAIIDVKF